MANANDRYRDLLFRHSSDMEGFESHLVLLIIELLNKTEVDLVAQISELLAKLDAGAVRPGPNRIARLESMLEGIRKIRTKTWTDVNKELRAQLRQLTGVEIDFATEAFSEAVQIQGATLTAPSAAAVRSATINHPFRLNATNARPLAGWMASLRVADQKRIEEAIKLGFIEAEDIDSIVRRIRGTRKMSFKDGLLQITRRQAEAVVRTAVNHYSNGARDALWAANSDAIEGLIWTSVLDGRTTPICQARDGRAAPNGSNPLPPGLPRLDPPNARPPAHAQCRSIMVAIISAAGLVGRRPFVVDTRTGAQRRVDFRRMARQQGRPIAAVRKEWALQRVGHVPAETTYTEFLKRQDMGFQIEVLGPTRARLFRRGQLDLDDFVTNAGRRYSISELRRRNADAFRRAAI